MSPQYGVPVGSSVNVMSGPGGAGGSMPGSGGGGHAGPGPYSGPNMQYHPGDMSAYVIQCLSFCHIYCYVILSIVILLTSFKPDSTWNQLSEPVPVQDG